MTGNAANNKALNTSGNTLLLLNRTWQNNGKKIRIRSGLFRYNKLQDRKKYNKCL